MDLNENQKNNGAPEGRRPHGGMGDGNGRSAAAERMREVAAAAVSGRASREELQAAARALVTELRQQNEPPEQALLQIKSFLAEAGMKPEAGAAPSMYRELIGWCIRYYYDGNTEAPTGSASGG